MIIRIKTGTEILTFETDKESIIVGRSSECDFVVPIEDFSRKHCQITVKGDYYFVKDLGSKNGVIVDKRRIPSDQFFPVYRGTKVVLANHFPCIFFEEIDPSEETKSELTLVKITDF